MAFFLVSKILISFVMENFVIRTPSPQSYMANFKMGIKWASPRHNGVGVTMLYESSITRLFKLKAVARNF